MTQHWTEDFTHDSLDTPESKEAFGKAMSKYESQEEAIIGGYNAIKETGKPFKLPESLDKMPGNNDEERNKNRKELMAGMGKLLGFVEKPEDLKDINWLLDSTLEGDKPDEELVKAVTEFAVAEKAPKSLIQKLAGFWNKLQAGGRAKYAELQKQQQAERNAKEAAKIKAVNEKLNADAGGNAEELKARVELAKRMFLNYAGLNADEYEEIADVMFNKGLIGNYAFNKAVINLAQNFKEGKTFSGDGNPPPPPPKPQKSNVEKTEKAIGIVS